MSFFNDVVDIDVFNYSLPYDTIFGGVVAFTKEQMELVNGFPNRYWGWGGESNGRRVCHTKIVSSFT